MRLFLATVLALTVCCSLLSGSQSVKGTNPTGGKNFELTDVVFRVAGATFPGRRPICSLESEDGRSYYAMWEFPWDAFRVKKDDPVRDEIGGPWSRWRRGVFQQVPVGTYTFVGRTTPFDPGIRIPDVEVTAVSGYGCYPAKVQDLHIVEPHAVSIGFTDSNNDPIMALDWFEEHVRIVEESESGFEVRANRILELETLRIDEDYLQPGYWLINP